LLLINTFLDQKIIYRVFKLWRRFGDGRVKTDSAIKTKTAQIRAVTYFHLEPMAGFEPATC
jgi:hypothetical protein